MEKKKKNNETTVSLSSWYKRATGMAAFSLRGVSWREDKTYNNARASAANIIKAKKKNMYEERRKAKIIS